MSSGRKNPYINKTTLQDYVTVSKSERNVYGNGEEITGISGLIPDLVLVAKQAIQS